MNEEKQSGGGSPWLKILGIGCFVILLLIGGCFGMITYTTMQGLKEAKKAMVREMEQKVLTAVEDADQKAKLKQIKGFADNNDMSLAGMGVFAGVTGDKLKDNKITPEEGQKLIDAYDMLIAKKTNVSFGEVEEYQKFGLDKSKVKQQQR